MNNKFLFLTFALVISGTKITQAADAVYYPPDLPVYDEASIWAGGYIGGQIGYNWAQNKLSTDYDTYSASSNGFMGGDLCRL